MRCELASIAQRTLRSSAFLRRNARKPSTIASASGEGYRHQNRSSDCHIVRALPSGEKCSLKPTAGAEVDLRSATAKPALAFRHSIRAVRCSSSQLPAMGALSDQTAIHQLDRERFRKVVLITAVKLPKQLCHRYMKMLRRSAATAFVSNSRSLHIRGFRQRCSAVLGLPKIKAVQVDDTDPDKRNILLREDVTDFGSPELPQGFREVAKKDGVEETSVKLQLDYSHASLESVLREILPDGFEIPSSFETVGHIAHLNLRDDCLPYRYVIGQVVLDKNPAIRTVVNKVGSIENEYRVLPMEVIAGEDWLEATVRQHSAQFKLNFREVYWNSRLEQEHQRLVSEFKPGEVVADIMAGIGPFAIPAGLLGAQVYANDLNPRSFHYLKENIKLNKVAAKVAAFQLDGREFIRRMAGNATDRCRGSLQGNAGDNASEDGRQTDAAIPASGIRFQHAIMNLPASAIEFLDAFRGTFDKGMWTDRPLPLVHVYTFAKGSEGTSDLRERAEHFLGGSINPEDFRTRLVRDVAPNKRMMLLTFRVPGLVAFASQPGLSDERCAKKPRTA